ncbi:MAG: hypothetical protein HYW01_05410 [Deltaproteobacteria bacterium]|nr:hypothetical protein [Deltaproteobacteria bacterium]
MKTASKFKLWKVAIHEGVRKYRVQVYADLFDEGTGEASRIECTFYLSKDTIDINKMEEQAVAKAEDLLRKALSDG